MNQLTGRRGQLMNFTKIVVRINQQSGIILNNIFYLNHENALKWAFLFFINFNLKIIREHRHTIDTR